MKQLTKMGALSHLRIIDFSQGLAGAYCTKLMAGFGAEVIKIEPPNGCPMRHVGPFVHRQPGRERSLPFLWFNTGKKSLVLALEEVSSQDLVKSLVQDVNVIITDLAPQQMASWGLDAENLQTLNPTLIFLSISNFGQTGPYRDYQAEEITLYALSGLMNGTGDDKQAPLAPGPSITQLSAGLKAYIATLMACYRREITGRGDRIDLSIQEAALDNLEIAIAEYLHLGKVARRNNDEHALVPWRTYPCRDGQAAIIGGPIRHWLKGIEVLAEPRLLESQYAHMEGRIKHRDDIRQLMAPWLLQHNKQEIFEIGQANKLAWGYLATLEEALQSPQTKERHFVGETEHPEVGQCLMLGAPFCLEQTPWQQERAPLLGEHTQVILQGIGNPSKKTASFSSHRVSPSAIPSQPLEGIRIVDLTHDWAGPHATRLMADYGAEVIKIEYPRRLDGMRGAYLEKKDCHPRWWQINRNKASITLDLHLPEHVEALKKLISQADILVDNSRPGVMEGFGLGHDVLKAIRPDIIVVAMSAFGATGPESHYAGYGGCIEAISGVQSLTAYKHNGEALRVREVDVTNGIAGACAIMTALIHRQKTGTGQWVDLSQRETCMWLAGEHFLEFALNQIQTLPIGNRHPFYAPQGCYPCQGEDRWLVLTIRSDQEWERFCQIIDHPEWLEAGLTNVHVRRENHDELDKWIETWTKTQEAEAAMQLLQSVGLAAGFVANTRDLANNPHLLARQWFQRIEGEERPYPGLPFHFAQGGGLLQRRGPDLGADNQRLLCDLLGLPSSVLPSLTDEELGTAFDLEST